MNWQTTLAELDLTSLQSVYLVGIKGVGMAALAVMLQEAGVAKVQGADTAEAFVTDALLESHQISVTPFESAELPADVQVVIFSGAHQGSHNPLVQTALARSLPAFSLAQAVGMLSQQKQTLAVCGVGGKSTTSALLSWILQSAGRKPSFAVGVGNIPNLGTTAHWEAGTESLVIEADEYVADPQADHTPRFLYLRPQHIISTALTFDHPDVYTSVEDTKHAFGAFFALIPENGNLIVNGDDPELVTLARASGKRIITVGESPQNDVCLANWSVLQGVGSVELRSPGGLLGESTRTLEIFLPGRHNLRNGAYAAVLAYQLGVTWEDIQKAVKTFQGVQRRFEFKGRTSNGVACYDDYAHHPREITALAQTVREWFPSNSIVVAFEPHTFSRTKALWKEFITAFQEFSDQTEILLLPIFASAREKADLTVTSEDLAEAMKQHRSEVKYVHDYQELLQYMQQLPSGTIFITVGAGTVYKVFDHVNFI